MPSNTPFSPRLRCRYTMGRQCRAAIRGTVRRGFTLIELMVAVAIVAILAAIAIPAYSNYIIRGHIPNATNGLSAAAAQMEQFFQDYRSYAQVGASPNPPCQTAAIIGDFTISCIPPANPINNVVTAGVTATTYTIVAAGSGTTAGFYYTIDNTGKQTSVAGTVWSSMFCPNTWIMKNGTC